MAVWYENGLLIEKAEQPRRCQPLFLKVEVKSRPFGKRAVTIQNVFFQNSSRVDAATGVVSR